MHCVCKQISQVARRNTQIDEIINELLEAATAVTVSHQGAKLPAGQEKQKEPLEKLVEAYWTQKTP